MPSKESDHEKVDFKKKNKWLVPIGVSNRHVHLSQKDIDALFGPGYRLTVAKELAPGEEFAARETITVVGSKGVLEKVRIVGPPRKETQVELSRTDAIKIGVDAPIRNSGDLAGSPGVVLIGPRGPVIIEKGCIIPSAHIHMTGKKAEQLDLADGDRVNVLIKGPRTVSYHNILVRIIDSGETEFHIDTDEANAAFVDTGDLALIQHPEMVIRDNFGNLVEVGVDNIRFLRAESPHRPEAAEALRLMKEVFGIAAADAEAVARKLLQPAFLEPDRFFMLLAMEDEKVVGLACFYYLPETRMGYLEHIGIIPEYRNRGVGTFLYHKLVSFLEKEHPEIEGILLEVPPGRTETDARKQFFLNAGAIPIDTDFYPSPNKQLAADGYLMFKPLVTAAGLNTVILERTLAGLERIQGT